MVRLQLSVRSLNAFGLATISARTFSYSAFVTVWHPTREAVSSMARTALRIKETLDDCGMRSEREE
jgi:hypothetical protein